MNEPVPGSSPGFATTLVVGAGGQGGAGSPLRQGLGGAGGNGFVELVRAVGSHSMTRQQSRRGKWFVVLTHCPRCETLGWGWSTDSFDRATQLADAWVLAQPTCREQKPEPEPSRPLPAPPVRKRWWQRKEGT